MRRPGRLVPLGVLLAAAAWLGPAAPGARAQHTYYTPPTTWGQPPCVSPPLIIPPPGATQQPPTQQPPTQEPTTPPQPQPAPEVGAGFGGPGGGAGLGGAVAVGPGGYIDPAVPATLFRLRFDAAYDDNRPDRAEFFYAKCGCTGAPDAKGPPKTEVKVDYQELRAYFELAPTERLSGFIEAPYRWINPVENDNANGFSDLNFGFKYAVVRTDNSVLTPYLRVVTPTGDPFKGLGQNNWRLEPGVLWQVGLMDRFTVFGQVFDSIPVSPESDFAGQVLMYGVGVGYTLGRADGLRVQPLLEVVGWTVLSGKELTDAGVVLEASGDTIVNAKVGARVYFGGHSDLYLGYGRALTGDVWYKDIARVEYRYVF
jgi:hypothetical protein